MIVCPCCGSTVANPDFIVDLNTNTVTRESQQVHLSRMEAELLEAFRRRFPGTLTEDNALNALYGAGDAPEAYAIALRVHVSKLRKRIKFLGMRIDNVRASGWRLVYGDT